MSYGPRTKGRLTGDLSVLRMIASGEPLSDILDALVLTVESDAGGMLGSVLLLEEGGAHLRLGAAPSLPPAYVLTLDGLAISPGAGSCCAAARTGETVIVSDIERDLLWTERRAEALESGLRACWSEPIRGADRRVLGTFAVYGTEPMKPTLQQLELTQHATHVAAVAIELHRRERELEHSETRSRSIIESALDANVIMEMDGTVTGWSGRAVDLFGWNVEEALGRRLSELIIPAALQERHEEALRRYRETGEGEMFNRRVEITARRRDGAEFPVELSITPIRLEDRVVFSGFISDITARKQLEDEVRQLQKMEAMGRLSGGVAHDFNNILGVILGYGHLLLREVQDDGQREQVRQIVTAGERGARLTRQFLAFSRRQVLQPEILDLNDLITNLEPMLIRLIGEDVALKTRLAEGLDRIEADPGQVEQVIMNLVVNARDAMPHGGAISIETAGAPSIGRELGGVSRGDGGPYVRLSISDTGSGMDAEVRRRMFEPFFTTKDKGKGSGLGLSMVYGVVTQSGGEIRVESEAGEGARFSLYFPRATGEARPQSVTEVDAVELSESAHRVLVVEDEPALRHIFQQTLERMGYSVSMAASAEEALRAVAQEGLRPDLLISDIVMPGMNGRVLAEHLRALVPELRVILISGYPDDALPVHLAPGEPTPFLQKPFSMIDLAGTIEQVMGTVTRP